MILNEDQWDFVEKEIKRKPTKEEINDLKRIKTEWQGYTPTLEKEKTE